MNDHSSDVKAEEPSWLSRNPSFIPPSRHELHNNDVILRAIHQSISLPVQHGLRDGGILRVIADTAVAAAVPGLLITQPKIISRMSEILQRRRAVIRYGVWHPMQVVEFYSDDCSGPTFTAKPTLIFVHGGAWGSGRPWMYRLVVDTFLALGFGSVFLVGYRTYPTAGIEAQALDLAAALSAIETFYLSGKMEISGCPVRCKATIQDKPTCLDAVLCGHSSGAHLISLVVLRKTAADSPMTVPRDDGGNRHCIGGLKLRGVVPISGVYDLVRHHHFEAKRGGHILSPMAAAAVSLAGLSSEQQHHHHYQGFGLPDVESRESAAGVTDNADTKSDGYGTNDESKNCNCHSYNDVATVIETRETHRRASGMRMAWVNPTKQKNENGWTRRSYLFGPHQDLWVAAALWRLSPLRLARQASASSPSPLSSCGVVWLVVHGCADSVVPLGQSAALAGVLNGGGHRHQDKGGRCSRSTRTLWLDSMDHQAFFPIMFPPQGALEAATAMNLSGSNGRALQQSSEGRTVQRKQSPGDESGKNDEIDFVESVRLFKGLLYLLRDITEVNSTGGKGGDSRQTGSTGPALRSAL
mmetsp:Transcript_16790/g.34204  ORF Transcript_16790/g.34204 Transcript_16790/m.34204 type:complete len:583 (-) Transcript_16790:35-1783(-)